jgi:Uma2 family endonuclease
MSADTKQLVRRPLKRTEFDRLVDAGMFEDEHIELLDGILVEMSPEGSAHSWLIQELTHILARGLPEDLRLRVGHPWAANDISQPEPDYWVVDLRDEVVHVHRQPVATAYEVVEQHGFDQALDAAGVAVRIADLLDAP